MNGTFTVNGLEIKINSLLEYYSKEELKDWELFCDNFKYNNCADVWLYVRTYEMAVARKSTHIYNMMRLFQEEIQDYIIKK
jgi:hypothetical protein